MSSETSAEEIVLTEVDARGVATVTLNRPEVNNAYNRDMIQMLITTFGRLAEDDAVRVVCIRGNGPHFQAGADLRWVKANRDLSWEDNLAISMDTTNAVRGLNEFPKPTIALIHGGCFGGGTGVAASCDIVIASADAIFSITEARWGLMASPIFPQLIARIGVRHTRRFAFTCERFGAARAHEIGLVDELCAEGALDETAAPIIDNLLMSAPGGISTSKHSILECAGGLVDDEMAKHLAHMHAEKRMSDEAIEGLMSFIEKRKPNWYPE